jgi:hypothetical protein
VVSPIKTMASLNTFKPTNIGIDVSKAWPNEKYSFHGKMVRSTTIRFIFGAP